MAKYKLDNSIKTDVVVVITPDCEIEIYDKEFNEMLDKGYICIAEEHDKIKHLFTAVFFTLKTLEAGKLWKG